MTMHRVIRALAAVLLASAGVPSGAGAQQPPSDVSPCRESEDSPHGRRADLCGPHRPFDLFGFGDNAIAGLRAAAPDITFAVANSSGGDRSVIGELPVYLRGVQVAPTQNSARFFEWHFYQAAARGDWLRAREHIPSLQNVRGGGWSFATNSSQYGGPDLYTGHDATIGVLFAGVTSAPGSCRDQSHSFIAAGRPLLAISDCPDTWANNTWRGSPHFNRESYLAYQQQTGAEDFAFDFWKLPASLADPDRQFIGTSAQTYAVSSDHGLQNRERYGNVLPGGSGDPDFEGYPMGLDWSWDAMTFAVSSVARMMVMQVKIVNNSREVYCPPGSAPDCRGIDYDSLYVGLQTRWLHAPPGLGRRANVHALPALGAVVANELGRTPTCDGATPVPGSVACSGVNGRVGRGFNAGASGVVYFKSPIGDLRNKQFTNARSPFHDPTHPHAGDTITYNRMSLCGFDCANVQFVPVDTRKAFGTIAARDVDALDGRPPASFTDYDYWSLFKPARGYAAGSRVDPNNPRAGGGFNFCVPGDWRYTNRPAAATAAGPDTLFFDTCNPTSNRMTGLWADTLPDRSLNWAFNNTWSGAGPFPLAAGDTTGLVFALISAPDSIQFMLLLRNAVDFYQEFYLGPGAPGLVRIRYAAADSGIAALGETRVRLYLDYGRAFEADPSIPGLVEDLRTAAPGTREARLVQLNPWLPDSILAKATALVDTVFVFKSCNGGQTFTARTTAGVCTADRAVDQLGRPVGTGWRAYAALVRDSLGRFPTTFTDENVTGGQRYLYSLVTHRPALEFTVVDSGVVGGQRTLVTTTYRVLDPGFTSLSTNRSAPNVAEVYVPVSSQAGSLPQRVAATVVGPTPLTFHTASVRTVAPFDTTLRYTIFFGDSIRVITRDVARRGATDSTTLVLFRSARVGFTTGTTARRVPRDSLVFRTDQLLTLHGGGTPARTSTQTAVVNDDTVRTTASTYRTFAAVVAEPTTMEPFFASASLAAAAEFQPPTALAQPGAPPLIFSVRQRTGALADQFWREPGFSRLRAVGTPTLGLHSWTATGAGFGEYVFTFRDTEWGPLSPFTITPADPALTDTVVSRSLSQRTRADSTEVSADMVAVLNRALGTSYTVESLAALYVPFTVRNFAEDTAAGRRVRLAALRSQVPQRIVLGSGLDTISVSVPANQWVPGTPLILVEDVTVADTTAQGRPAEGAGGQLVTRLEPTVTFSSVVLGCDPASEVRLTCNPVIGLGASDYVRVRPQQALHARFTNPFTAESQLAFTVEPALAGVPTQVVTARGLDDVKVVPNPYVVQATFEQGIGENERRLMFTHVPPQGIIRIYTAAGALVQALTWTPDMLGGTGDLFWDMRTREGFEAGPGLYLFTVEATGPGGGAKRKKPGRFIIIR